MSAAQPKAERDHEAERFLDGVWRLLLGGHPVRLVIDASGSDPNRISLRVEQGAHGLEASQALVDHLTAESPQQH